MGRGLVLGVGINDSPSHHGCQLYSRWKGVLRRCHSKNGDVPDSYKGCRVVDEWLRFSAFRAWMVEQPWQGNHLDKDILRPWEKLYCPETSVFVPQYINTLMSEKPSSLTGLPVGVVRTLRGRPYMAMIRVLGAEKVGLGVFDTAEDAHRAWAKAKSVVIAEAIDRYRTTDRYDERVCAALMDRAKQLAEI